MLKAKLTGHYQYYGISGNMRAIAPLLPPRGPAGPEMAQPPQPAANRSPGRRFRTYLKHYPLPRAADRPQPVHPVACDVSFTEEPDVGNLQVRFCEGH